MRTFTIIWLGQSVSLLGSAMTRFVLAIWLWQQTQQATALVMVGICASLASILSNLVAGPLVDRWNRKKIILWADLGAGIVTICLLVLFASHRLEVWHLYLASALSGAFGTFQFLAFSASMSTMLPKEQYTRANAMLSLTEYASLIGAPLFAGILVTIVGVAGVMLIDVATFLAAVGTVLFATIPMVRAQEDQADSGKLRTGILSDAVYGFRYMAQRRALVLLLLITGAFNFAESLGYPLIYPMVLARTNGNEFVFGTVQSVMGIGGIVGGILLTVWGGPKRKIHALLLGMILTGLLGNVLMGVGRGIYVWLIAAIFLEVFMPAAVSSSRAIWQSKVDPGLQGRVFAARNLVSNAVEPLAQICGGLLADHFFEPAMRSQTGIAPALGQLVGTGPGSGMAILIVLCGVLSACAGVAGYLISRVRDIEEIYPDHDQVVTAKLSPATE